MKYIEDNGSGFSAAADVDASGSNPTVVLAAGKRFVYYEKNGKVYLATDKTLYVNPVVSGVSDGGVYNTDKTVTWDSGTGTLDGASLSSGDTVSTEGAHVLVVSNENGSTTVNFTIDKTAPVITIAPYNGTTPTNQDITVTASTDEGNLNETSRTFTVNGSFAFIATDAAGNSATETVTITNIDKTAPTASVSYDITAPTNTDVIATMNPSEAVIVTSAGGSTHTFSENSSFTFEFRDDAGNTGSATASVSNIDRVAPIITVNPYNSTVVTNQDITVTVSTNEGTLNAASHTFSANGSFDFVAIDAAGNATTNTVTITNIDKVGPTITLGAYDGATPTNQDITVTASTDEGTLNAASHVFSANGSFDFVATDAAGNATTKTVTITNIDKTAPTASVSYDITTLTNLDVVATLHPSEEVTVTSGEGQLTHSFAANGDYNFTFTDAAGNAGSATASVNYIDKTAPIVTIAPYDGTTMTNQDITVNASTDEGTLNASSHTFSANGALSILSRLTRQETLRPERSPSPTSTRTPRQAAFPTT